jgi:hypothetical protein
MVTEVFSVPASTSLRREFAALAPNKSTAQNGTIGDRSHMERNSDHNLDEIGNTGTHSDPDTIREVHARDEDSRGPWPPGWSMERCVQIILARCRSGAETRLLYIIYNGRIWEASNGWRERKYDGADQHTEHAHFSFRYGSGSGTSNPENVTSPWGILAAYRAEIDNVDTADVKQIWTTDGIVATPSNASDFKTNPKRTPGEALTNIEYHVRALEAALAAQGKVLTQLATRDTVDEQALAAALAPLIAALLPVGVEVTPAVIVEALRELAAK